MMMAQDCLRPTFMSHSLHKCIGVSSSCLERSERGSRFVASGFLKSPRQFWKVARAISKVAKLAAQEKVFRGNFCDLWSLCVCPVYENWILHPTQMSTDKPISPLKLKLSFLFLQYFVLFFFVYWTIFSQQTSDCFQRWNLVSAVAISSVSFLHSGLLMQQRGDWWTVP